jgi:asparagine synthase (glutamine-hydrolysing)
MVRRGGVDPEQLRQMARALAHRGPDGEGSARFDPFVLEGDAWQAGFSHRRLAVFDPTPAGAQPMTSRSGRTEIVLNGEIFNHSELRRRLPGFPWRTSTDTEVLLELLEREGAAALARLNGIFAFAVWDRERRRLWLGRDRLGVKPVFYRLDKDGMVFASELRAILAGPRFRRQLRLAAVSAYLDFGFVPAPMTALEGVAKLPPGTLLEWHEGETRIRCWWQLPPSAPEPRGGWREGLYARLVEAVRLQLRSDVPVGCFLSGGIDSTLLAALAVRECGELHTFSASFPEAASFDEASHARFAARRLGTRHREIPLTAAEIRRNAPAILQSVDEPFADSSLLPLYLLSRAVRSRVTVALAGDGADELFAGYRRYGADRWLARWHRLPSGIRGRLLEPLLRNLSDDRSTALGDLVRRARKVMGADGLDEGARAFSLARIFGEAEKLRLAPGLAEQARAGVTLFREVRASQRGRDGLDTQLRVDLSLGLPDDMLVKVDRASMAHGLEVRVPYLDHRFVEHAVRLPSELKRRGGRSKLALLDVFGASIPRRIRRRSKSGFDAPLTSWLRSSLRELVRDTLTGERLARSGWIAPAAVTDMVDAHERGAADHSWRIWSLLVLVDWSSRHEVL